MESKEEAPPKISYHKCPAGGEHQFVARKERVFAGYNWDETASYTTGEVVRCAKCGLKGK